MILSSRKNLEHQIYSQIGNPLVYKAVKKVDRKLFVPKKWEKYAYNDNAITLDKNSSISQPSLVAKMIDLLKLTGNENVLEIGTGSGYSAAILSFCSREVNTIEIDPDLAGSAKKRLEFLKLKNVSFHVGDGSVGLESSAPYDCIIVNAVVKEIPKALIDQLKEGGRIVIPIQMKEPDIQELFVCLKLNNKLIKKSVTPVSFVPLVSEREE